MLSTQTGTAVSHPGKQYIYLDTCLHTIISNPYTCPLPMIQTQQNREAKAKAKAPQSLQRTQSYPVVEVLLFYGPV